MSPGAAGLGAAEECFGEFAAAGTTQSSVVSVLRAQHRVHSSPRISLGAWKVSQDFECRVLGSALHGVAGAGCHVGIS